MINRSKLKEFVRDNHVLLSFLWRLFGCNRVKVAKGNILKTKGTFLTRCNICISGKGNSIVIEPGLTRLNDCTLNISGTGCNIIIGSGSNLRRTGFYIEDSGGRIELKEHVTICGRTELASVEGTFITIGADSLFSGDIFFRTGDSHSIFDLETGARLNASKDISVGDRVWIGSGVRILKGVRIGNDSVVAAGAVITSGDYPSNCVLGGVGKAKILRSGIVWNPQR